MPWHRAFAADAPPPVRSEAMRLRFDLPPTSYVFKAGRRIQPSVTGSAPRKRVRDPTTSPTITPLNDAAHASLVTLPVVKR